MVTQPPLPGQSGSKSSQLADTLSNMSLIDTPQEPRHQLVHRNSANATTKTMTQNAHSKIVCRTEHGTNKKQHAVGFEYIHIVVNCCQFNIECTAGVYREQGDQLISAHNEKPPWSTKTFVCTVCEMEHHYVATSGIFAEEFPDKYPHEWMKQALITLEEATEVYMVEVIATPHC